ncbi:MAG: hypothetical protein CHACPFDD_01462 [Phycisphaerae bacterium]|nr:hypothetical protein [Phycisphaerae bacterium]
MISIALNLTARRFALLLLYAGSAVLAAAQTDQAASDSSQRGAVNSAVPAPQASIARRFDAPPRAFDLRRLAVEIVLTQADIEARVMHATATLDLVARSSPTGDGGAAVSTQSVALNAVKLKIASVELDAGEAGWVEAPHEYADDLLRVTFDPLPTAGEVRRVRVRYTARAGAGLYFVLPDENHPERPTVVYSMSEPLECRRWVPCIDWPDVRFGTDVTFLLPEPYSGVCVGEPVAQEGTTGLDVADGRHRANPDAPLAALRPFRWRLDTPIDPHMFGFALGEFKEIQLGSWRGRPSYVYTHPRYEAAARFTFARVPDMLEFYTRVTGVEYPFSRVSHVVVEDHFHGGMEHVGFDMLSPGLLTTGDNGDVPPDRAQFNYVAHMLGHQWFGGAVNYRSIYDAWLNEGFGTLLHQLWRGEAFSYEGCAKDERHLPSDDWFVDNMYETGRTVARMASGRSLVNEDIAFPNQIYTFDGGAVYWRGAWILHMLRHQLGEETFTRGVSRYLQRHGDLSQPLGGTVVTEHLRTAMEEASGRNLTTFFEQWVFRGGAPKLRVEYDWDNDRAVTVVTVHQDQSIDEKHPPFEFPLDLYTEAAGKALNATVTVGEARQTFEIPTPPNPRLFCVDPHGALLARIEEVKPPTMWEEQARRGPTAHSRTVAIEHLKGEKPGPGTISCLSDCVRDERLFWGTRRRAVEALALFDSDDGRHALREAEKAGIAHPRVLAELVDAIGGFGTLDDYRTLLKHGEPAAPAIVRAAAVRRLGDAPAAVRKLESDPAGAELLEQSRKVLLAAAAPGTSAQVREPAFRALRGFEDADMVDWAIASLKRGTDDPLAMRNRTINLLARVAGRNASRASDAIAALRAAAGDRRPSVAVTAIRGIERVGGAAAEQALRDMKSANLREDVQKAIDTALENLAKPEQAPAASDEE